MLIKHPLHFLLLYFRLSFIRRSTFRWRVFKLHLIRLVPFCDRFGIILFKEKCKVINLKRFVKSLVLDLCHFTISDFAIDYLRNIGVIERKSRSAKVTLFNPLTTAHFVTHRSYHTAGIVLRCAPRTANFWVGMHNI